MSTGGSLFARLHAVLEGRRSGVACAAPGRSVSQAVPTERQEEFSVLIRRAASPKSDLNQSIFDLFHVNNQRPKSMHFVLLSPCAHMCLKDCPIYQSSAHITWRHLLLANVPTELTLSPFCAPIPYPLLYQSVNLSFPWSHCGTCFLRPTSTGVLHLFLEMADSENSYPIAEAIVKVCLQIGTIVYGHIPIRKEDGSVVHYRIPLALMEKLRLATNAQTVNAKEVVEFEQSWKEYASKSQHPLVQEKKDDGIDIVFNAKLSGFDTISWASAGLESNELICMLRLIFGEDGSFLSKYYATQCKIVEKMINLLDSLGERYVRNQSAASLLYNYFYENESQIMLIPVFSLHHAVYMIIFPPEWSATPNQFTVAMCDGSAENTYHKTVLEHDPKLEHITLRGHCVFVSSKDDILYLLKKVGEYWEYETMHDHLSNYINERFVRRDVQALYEGRDPLFLDQNVFLADQVTGNCALHNLLEVLKFVVADSFNVASNRFKNANSLFKYAFFDTAMRVLRTHRADIVACFHEMQFAMVERMVSVHLCKQYSTINPELGGALESLVHDIAAKHKENIVGVEDTEAYLQPRMDYIEAVHKHLKSTESVFQQLLAKIQVKS